MVSCLSSGVKQKEQEVKEERNESNRIRGLEEIKVERQQSRGWREDRIEERVIPIFPCQALYHNKKVIFATSVRHVDNLAGWKAILHT